MRGGFSVWCVRVRECCVYVCGVCLCVVWCGNVCVCGVCGVVWSVCVCLLCSVCGVCVVWCVCVDCCSVMLGWMCVFIFVYVSLCV